MSALSPKADKPAVEEDVRQVPEADFGDYLIRVASLSPPHKIALYRALFK
jgi:hypothetical protein